MKTTATNRKIRVLLTAMREGGLVPNPSFQRRLVWKSKDKQNFLKTVLDDYPFPEIYIAAGDVNLETGEGTEMLVDGQQRLTTLNQYFTDSPDLELSDDIPPYAELPDDAKKRFLEYDVVIRDLGSLSIAEIRSVFRRINSTSYSLNAMEIQNSRFDGEYKVCGENVAANPFFAIHRFFSTNEIRRMEDTKFALTWITTMLSNYFNRDIEIEGYLATYNEEFKHGPRIKKETNRVLKFIDDCEFEPSLRVWKKADMFTLLVEIHRALEKSKLNLVPYKTGEHLKKFYESVDRLLESNRRDDDAGNYHKAALQATNDRGNRVVRGEIIERVLAQS